MWWLAAAVVAVVVAKDGHVLAEADVRAHCAAHLASFKAPKKVFFVDELPRNAMGKVQKNLLREDYRNLFTGK